MTPEETIEALREYAPEGTSQKLRDAEAAIERVRALHKVCTKIPFDEGGCEPGDCDEPVCVHDGQAWPCLTIRALEEGKQ